MKTTGVRWFDHSAVGHFEQNARMALSVATRGYVLETGTITLSGSAAELAADPKVKQAYLGG